MLNSSLMYNKLYIIRRWFFEKISINTNFTTISILWMQQNN